MKASEQAYQLIKHFEGLRLKAYKCPAGIHTIGYGHTANVQPGMTITQAQADNYLREDIAQIETILNSHHLALNQNMFDALVSFIFNVGPANFSKSTLLAKIKINPHDDTILDEFIKWVYSKGKVLLGLQKRRLAEAKLYYL